MLFVEIYLYYLLFIKFVVKCNMDFNEAITAKTKMYLLFGKVTSNRKRKEDYEL